MTLFFASCVFFAQPVRRGFDFRSSSRAPTTADPDLLFSPICMAEENHDLCCVFFQILPNLHFILAPFTYSHVLIHILLTHM